MQLDPEDLTLWQDVATSILSLWTLALALASWRLLQVAKALERDAWRQARLKRWLLGCRMHHNNNPRQRL
jgi:hypothetical protein